MATPNLCCSWRRAPNSTFRRAVSCRFACRCCVSAGCARSDYLRDLTWAGLIKRFGPNATDYRRICHIYKDCPSGGNYGGGIGYSRLVDGA
jgi:hypothetical protein